MRSSFTVSILCLALLFSCRPVNEDVPPGGGVEPSDTTEVRIPEGYFADSVSVAALWSDKFAHEGSIASASDVKYMKWLVDGVPAGGYDKSLRRPSADLRYEFVGEDYVRFVSEADGYAFSYPSSLGLEPDYTLPKYAQKFESEELSIRITLERVKPYTPNEYYYGIYTGEWLSRYIANKNYVSSNGFAYFEERVVDSEDLLPGCSHHLFDQRKGPRQALLQNSPRAASRAMVQVRFHRDEGRQSEIDRQFRCCPAVPFDF